MLKLLEDAQRLMAAEQSLYGPIDALQLTIGKPFGIWNIKLTKCVGITGALAIADLVALAGIDLIWACMDKSVISIVAAPHTTYTCPQTRYLDLDGSFDLSRDAARGGFALLNGSLHLLEELDLGVTLAD